MGMYCLDANVFITAWDVLYPKDVFPSLWDRLSEIKDSIVLLDPVYDEIKPLDDGTLKEWLHRNYFSTDQPGDGEEHLALHLEAMYETDPNAKGAGQVDIALIAYAKINSKTVVTMEAVQKIAPKKKSYYKIPLICKEQSVSCIDFVAFLRKIGITV